MINQLEVKQIDELVKDSVVGTLICFDNSGKKKFPITFITDRNYIYSYSKELENIQLMRKDPAVLLKIFKLRKNSGWFTVNVLGIYEELDGIDSEIARCLMKDKLLSSGINDISIRIGGLDAKTIEDNIEKSDVIYRISIIKKSGKSRRL